MNTDIELRDFLDADKDRFERWLSEAHVAEWYEHPADWIYEVQHREDEFSWIHHFIVMCGDMPIGFCQFYEYSLSGETWHGSMNIEGAYSIDYLIGEKDYMGKGLGKKIVLDLLERIFLCENATSVIVQPDAENKASRGTLLSAGFLYDANNRLFRLSRREAAKYLT